MIRTACVAFFLFLPFAAAAQSGCKGQSQIELNMCAKERWKHADAALNGLWGSAKSAAETRGHGQELLDSQRAWMRQRDTRCGKELDDGGSAADMFYWSCMEEMTAARNDQLRAMAR